MKKLQKVLDTVHEAIFDEMYEAVKEGEKHVLALIDITDDIQIDIEITNEVAEVCVFNRKNLERYYPNIESAIIENLPVWEQIKTDGNIWDIHGFSDEQDYLRWKYA